jgi:tungstate transport system substrate-binding protein
MRGFRARAAFAVFLVAGCRRAPAPVRPVIVLTTQRLTSGVVSRSVADAFHRQSSVPIDFRAVSTDDILQAADARSGAVAIYRDPELDAELLRRHAIRLRSEFAREEYVITGPHRDPAHVARAGSAADAFKRIVKANRVFCSPADLPVLLAAEKEVWSAADEGPPSGSRYRKCHGNASDMLAQAAHFDAYTITDLATAEARLPAASKILLRGVPILRSTYIIALLEYDTARNRNAEWFVEWMMSYRGREVVQGLRSASAPKLYLPERP